MPVHLRRALLGVVELTYVLELVGCDFPLLTLHPALEERRTKRAGKGPDGIWSSPNR